MTIVMLSRWADAGALAADCAEALAGVLSDEIERCSLAVMAHTTAETYELRLSEGYTLDDERLTALRALAETWLRGWRSALGAVRTRAERDALSTPRILR